MENKPVRLGDLIEYVDSRQGSTLDHVGIAVSVGDEMGELADQLIGHFVSQARKQGASWTEIGRSMGVSKQAAQKRFVPKPASWPDLVADAIAMHRFSRFTDRAKHVMTAAQDEARQHADAAIGTVHLALGLLHEPDGLGVRAMEALGAPSTAVHEALTAALGPASGPASGPAPGDIPFAHEAKQALALALRDALQLGHNYIGTEHLLLGVLDAADEPGGRTLAGLGITSERATAWLVPELRRLAEERQR